MRVMQVVDSLWAGGLESVAVNIGNALVEQGVESHLCSTRVDGPLAASVYPAVKRLRLDRKGRFDVPALCRFVAYNRQNRIEILHAHGSSVFISLITTLFPPYPKVVWHVHFGSLATHADRAGFYWLAGKRSRAVITVSRPLFDWCHNQLRIQSEKIQFIPNFIGRPPANQPPAELPGHPGFRIVCVANLRPEKDHVTLLRAMKDVIRTVPKAHLLLVGGVLDAAYHAQLNEEIRGNGLGAHVTWLGPRRDVASILKACDVGVLSSAVEGLPMALLEYGIAGLAAVTTRVGQCAEVLEDGRCGILVAPGSPGDLAAAITRLLSSPEERNRLAAQFLAHVEAGYTAEAVIPRLRQVYDAVLAA